MSDLEPIRRDERRGIRFQLSVLLLLSTLNGLALAAVSLVMWTTISEDPEPGRMLRRSLAGDVDQVHVALMVAAATGEPFDIAAAQAPLEDIGARLSSWGPEGRDVIAALARYRNQLAGLRGPEGTGTATVAGVPEERMSGIEEAHASLRGAIYALPDALRPAWVMEATQIAPLAIGWVLLLTLVTVFEAFRLRTSLSLPLERLTAVAREVSAGRLDVDMPRVAAGSEITELARAMRVMRDRLVKSIRNLDDRNEEMSTILANLTDGVMLVDAGGRIAQLNLQASRLIRDLTGLTADPGVNVRALLTSLPPTWLGSDRQDTQRELSFGREGKESYLLVRTTPVTRHEDVDRLDGGFVVVLRDVTQTKEVEKLKRDFLSVVTHELKTPLTAIEGYTKLLLMGKAGPLSDRQRTFLDTVQDQTGNLKTMIQDLLDITRLEAGRLPLSMAKLDPTEIVSEAVEAHGGGAEAANLVMKADTSAVDGARIIADPFRLQQVLGNLIGNAFKFTPTGGEVVVLAGKDDKSVWFSVSDTGRGIPEASLPHLFDKFYQVQQDDTRVSGGAGLGLYICRELVEAQGGTIEVRSTVGVGTIFTIRFDAADALEREDSVTETTVEA